MRLKLYEDAIRSKSKKPKGDAKSIDADDSVDDCRAEEASPADACMHLFQNMLLMCARDGMQNTMLRRRLLSSAWSMSIGKTDVQVEGSCLSGVIGLQAREGV